MFWFKKDISKVKSTLLQWILQNILENQTFQRIENFIMAYGRFLWTWKMDFMKGVISVKVDEMYNVLKSTNHCLLVERWRWNWMIKVFARVCPWMSRRLLRPSFIKGQASTRIRYRPQRKSLILQYRWHWSTLVQRSKENRMEEKK